MIDLPVATRQPYPTKNPWYDVSQYLTPGLSPYQEESVLACADANFVHYSFFITIDRTHPELSTHWLVGYGAMHPSLRVFANSATTGWFTTSSGETGRRVEASVNGYIAMPRWPSMGVKLADYTGVNFTLTAPRRIP